MEILLVLDHNTFGDEYIDVAKSCAPYCSAIWYRSKELTLADTYERAARLREALPDSRLILSEHADAAYMLGYEGVHLNAASLPVEAVKSAFGSLIVGYSAHGADECCQGADYYTLSPVFNTHKPYDVSILGAIPAPCPEVFALGGINTENVAELKGLGYRGVAGISFYREIKDIVLQSR